MASNYNEKIRPPVRIFCSYSHCDEYYRDELEGHLKVLERNEVIDFWYDREIVPSNKFNNEIEKHLLEADIILLLVSSYFLKSDYCYEVEMQIALKRHEDGNARVIPIFIRPCYWKDAPFSEIQGLPNNAIPITKWDDYHEALTEVVKGIKKVIIELQQVYPKPYYQETKRPVPSYETKSQYSNYFEHLKKEYERAPWTNRAIELSAITSSGKKVKLAEELLKSVLSDSKPLLFLIGKFGSGKTWALKRLAYDLAHYMQNNIENSIIPIFVSLNKICGQDDKISLESGLGEWKELLKKENYSKCYVFLLDGLDEISFHSEEKALKILHKVIVGAPEQSRFIISCRTQAFKKMPNCFPSAHLAHIEVFC